MEPTQTAPAPQATAGQPVLPGVIASAPPAPAPAPVALPPLPPTVPAAGPLASAPTGTTIPPEVEAAVLARYGLSGPSEVDELKALRARYEAEKPDAKLQRELTERTRAHSELDRRHRELQAEAEGLRGQVAAHERAKQEARTRSEMEQFATGIADGIHVRSEPGARRQFHRFVEHGMTVEKTDKGERLVFVDGGFRFQAASEFGQWTTADVDRFRAELGEHVKREHAYLLAEAPAGAGTGLHGRTAPPPSAPGASRTVPGRTEEQSKILAYLQQQAGAGGAPVVTRPH